MGSRRDWKLKEIVEKEAEEEERPTVTKEEEEPAAQDDDDERYDTVTKIKLMREGRRVK